MTISGFVFAQESRGVGRIEIKGPQHQSIVLYEASYALVVGVSRYTAGWPILRGVDRDIDSVSKALKGHGFHVRQERDLDADRLRVVITEFIQQRGSKPKNRLLLYFAGHGHTQQLAYDQMGFFVPANAPRPNNERNIASFLSKALSMSEVELFARRIQSKHALFVFDSCFSGTIFSQMRSTPENITNKTVEPVRQFITSGTADEVVPDESVFRKQFVAALAGQGDTDGDRYITGVELGEYLHKTVSNFSRGAQHPTYGKLSHPELSKGDFVFQLKQSKTISGSPSGHEFSIDDLVQENWNGQIKKMTEAYNSVQAFTGMKNTRPDLKRTAWKRFLDDFGEDNPYSNDDELMRRKARLNLKRLESGNKETHDSAPINPVKAAEYPPPKPLDLKRFLPPSGLQEEDHTQLSSRVIRFPGAINANLARYYATRILYLNLLQQFQQTYSLKEYFRYFAELDNHLSSARKPPLCSDHLARTPTKLYDHIQRSLAELGGKSMKAIQGFNQARSQVASYLSGKQWPSESLSDYFPASQGKIKFPSTLDPLKDDFGAGVFFDRTDTSHKKPLRVKINDAVRATRSSRLGHGTALRELGRTLTEVEILRHALLWESDLAQNHDDISKLNDRKVNCIDALIVRMRSFDSEGSESRLPYIKQARRARKDTPEQPVLLEALNQWHLEREEDSVAVGGILETMAKSLASRMGEKRLSWLQLQQVADLNQSLEYDLANLAKVEQQLFSQKDAIDQGQAPTVNWPPEMQRRLRIKVEEAMESSLKGATGRNNAQEGWVALTRRLSRLRASLKAALNND